jgi:hypothetical protein
MGGKEESEVTRTKGTEVKQIQVGSTVVVRLYDGGEVEAKVTRIVDSVAGRKIHIRYGIIALKVDEAQIVREVKP